MWKCKKCYEEVEDNFDICWNCGCDRNGSNPTDEFEKEKSERSPSSETKSKLTDASVKKQPTQKVQNVTQGISRTSNYKVVPFNRTENIPSALQNIIDTEAVNGWKYINHQYSDKLRPGSAGCFGVGATPDSTIHVGVVIFHKE